MALTIAETQALAITLAAHIVRTAPRTGQTPKEYLNAKRSEAAKNRRARSSSSSRRRGTTTLESILLDAREGADKLPDWLLQAASIGRSQDEPDSAAPEPSGQSRTVQGQEHLANDGIAEKSYLALTSSSQDAAQGRSVCGGATEDSYEAARASSTMMTDSAEAAATAAAASIQPPLSPPATQPSAPASMPAPAAPAAPARAPALPTPTKAPPDLSTLFTQAITTSAVRIHRLFRELHRQARRQDHASMSTTATRQASASSMMASPPGTALSSSAPTASTPQYDDAGFALLQAIETECDKLESTLRRVLSTIAAPAAAAGASTSLSSSTGRPPSLPRCPKAEELLATCCRPIPPPSSSLSEDCFSGGLFGGMARDRVREVRGLLIRSTAGGGGGGCVGTS